MMDRDGFLDRYGNRWLDVDSCLVCAEEDSACLLKISARDYPFPTDISPALLRCRRCDLRWVSPQVVSIAAENRSSHPGNCGSDEPAVDLTLYRWALEKLGVYCSAGKLLDVGCGTGRLLKEAQRLGWEALGIDPSEERTEYARKASGLKVLTGHLESAGLPAQYYDAVTMTEVLEHLRNPRGLLKEIYRVLKEDGILLITTPNPNCLEALIHRSKWAMFCVATHYNFYSDTALRRLLSETGYQLQDRITWVKGSNNVKNIARYVSSRIGVPFANTHIVIVRKRRQSSIPISVEGR